MGEAAENSIDAFVRATSLGLKYLEIDLCGTPSGELIVWHGRIVDRGDVHLYRADARRGQAALAGHGHAQHGAAGDPLRGARVQ